jgi:hypothetical protein
MRFRCSCVGFFTVDSDLDAPADCQDPAAKFAAAIEFPARARSVVVDRAEARYRVQGDTGAVTALLHAAHPVVFHDEHFRHMVHPLHEFDRLVAAATAAGAGGKVIVVVRGNASATWTSFPVAGDV